MIDETMTKEIQRANARTAGSIEIRHVGKMIGWGVFALKEFKVGDMVLHPNVIPAIPSDDDGVIDKDDSNTTSKEDKEDVAESANVIHSDTLLTEPTLHTIQIDWKKHVLTDLPTRFMNRMCGTANVGIDGHNKRWNLLYDFYA
jgi:hypothetical protein